MTSCVGAGWEGAFRKCCLWTSMVKPPSLTSCDNLREVGQWEDGESSQNESKEWGAVWGCSVVAGPRWGAVTFQHTSPAPGGIHQWICSSTPIRASPDSRIQEVLGRHSDIFKEELGHIKGAPVTLHTDPSQQPRFFKACLVPYALHTKI